MGRKIDFSDIKPTTKKYLSPLSVADILNVSVRTVRKWISNGDMPFFFIGTSLYITGDVVNNWLEKKEDGRIMSGTVNKPGSIPAIIYFINEKGYIHILPTDEESRRFRKHMRKLGFEMMVADTLKEAEKLQSKMQAQLYQEQQNELAKDEQMTHYRRKQIRDRLYARRNSASTNQTEKDFIDAWLVMRERKHDIFKQKFTSQIGHLDALEFDDPNKHIHDLHDRVK